MEGPAHHALHVAHHALHDIYSAFLLKQDIERQLGTQIKDLRNVTPPDPTGFDDMKKLVIAPTPDDFEADTSKLISQYGHNATPTAVQPVILRQTKHDLNPKDPMSAEAQYDSVEQNFTSGPARPMMLLKNIAPDTVFPVPGTRSEVGGVEGQTEETMEKNAEGYDYAARLGKYFEVNGIPRIHQKMVVMLSNVVSHDMDGKPHSTTNTALKLSKRLGGVPVDVRGRLPSNGDEVCSIYPMTVPGMETIGKVQNESPICNHQQFISRRELDNEFEVMPLYRAKDPVMIDNFPGAKTPGQYIKGTVVRFENLPQNAQHEAMQTGQLEAIDPSPAGKIWVKAFNPAIDANKPVYMFMPKKYVHYAESNKIAQLFRLIPRVDVRAPDGNIAWQAAPASYADFTNGPDKTGVPLVPLSMPVGVQDFLFTRTETNEGEAFNVIEPSNESSRRGKENIIPCILQTSLKQFL